MASSRTEEERSLQSCTPLPSTSKPRGVTEPRSGGKKPHLEGASKDTATPNPSPNLLLHCLPSPLLWPQLLPGDAHPDFSAAIKASPTQTHTSFPLNYRGKGTNDFFTIFFFKGLARVCVGGPKAMQRGCSSGWEEVMLAGEGLCSRTGGVQPSAIPIWWELCQGGNSPQLHFQRAHRGLGNYLSFPPRTPLKNEPWRRGRASSCKCHSISPCPLLPCSLYLRCPSPAKMTMLTSGEPAAGEGREEAFVCTGKEVRAPRG